MIIFYPEWWDEWIEYSSDGEEQRLKEDAPESIRKEFERIQETKRSYRELRGPFAHNIDANGSYSEIYYFDEQGDIVDETKAIRCVIRECAADGSLIRETWGICDDDNHSKR